MKVSGIGEFCHEVLQGPTERSPHSVLCVFFKISSHTRDSSLFGQILSGVFFLSWNSLPANVGGDI